MTLSRGPCDLDNMSLFQDLKLKRRKVDSRCSSDGKLKPLSSNLLRDYRYLVFINKVKRKEHLIHQIYFGPNQWTTSEDLSKK